MLLGVSGGLLSCNFSAHRSVRAVARAVARADLIWKHNFLSPPTAAAKVIALNQLFIPQTMELGVDGRVGEEGGRAELGRGHRAPPPRRFYIRPSVPNSQ